MSKQIDERVVEMRFDNAQFEKNVSTTMSTLEKLKQSLNLTGAAKGFEDMNSAVKKVDMGVLGNGVEAVGLKFNALYTIADQTLRNITNRVQHAAENMVKSLTIQPITTGFNEYELKMGSIQTIMASTGESLETVNSYLNELNEYSDKTIYSFSDMTQNIGKFTNAGVKLEDAVLAIKGISNEAAVSGANANEASRAMYNFAQALSAGYVKLIDWKSIENANMATVEFKNYLLEAAVAAGTLEKQADGMYKVLTSNAQGSTFDQLIDATHYFNDSLNYQWMTTDALVSTLKDYADETTDIGKKAYASAQDIKTFSQMMDTLKESAQSGWATTWELIVGDFEVAKNMWTTVGKVVGDFINQMSDSRNNLIRGAFTSKWDELVTKITEAGISMDDLEVSMRDVLKNHGEDVDALIKKHGSLEQVFRNEAWGSEYLKEAIAGLNSELVDLSDIQNTLKKGSTGEDVKKIQQALKDAGFQCGEFGEALDGVDGKLGKVTEAAIKAFQEANGLEVDGIVGPETFKALEKATKKTSQLEEGVDELIDSIDELGGRELAIEGLKNIFEAIRRVIVIVKDSWRRTFKSFDSEDLYNLIERFHTFTKTLTLNSDTAHKLSNTFDGLFAALKLIKDIVVGVVSAGVKLIGKLFKPLAKVTLSATSAIGKFIKSAANVVSKVFTPLGKAASGVIDVFGELVDFIGEQVVKCIDALSELEIIQTISEWFTGAAEVISGAVDSIKTRMSNLADGKISSAFDKFKQSFGSIGKWWNEFKNSERGETIISGILSPFIAIIDWFKSIKLPKITFEGFFDGIYKFFDYLQTNEYTGVLGTIKGAFSYIGYWLSGKWVTFENNMLTKFSDFYLKHGDKIKAGIEKCKEIVKTVAEFIFGSEKISLGSILDLGQKFLTFMILLKSLNIVGDVSGAFDAIADAFEGIGKGLKWRAIGAAFLSLAAVLGVFAISMKIVETMNPEDAWRSAAILGLVLVAMGGIVAGLLVVSKKINGSVNLLAAAASLMALAISIGILVFALKTIDATEFNNIGSSFTILISVVAALSAAMAIIGKTCGGANLKSAAALLTLMVSLKMVLDVLDAYAEYDWNTVLHVIPVMAGVLIGLAGILRLATGGIKAGASVAGMASLMLAITISLKLLVGVISDLGEMDPKQMWRGIGGMLAVLTGIGLVLAGVNATSNVTVVDKGMKAISGFAGLATALLAASAAIAILGKLPESELKQGGRAVTQIIAVFTGMMFVLGKATSGGAGVVKMSSIIIGMALIFAELAIILHLLKDIDGKDAMMKFGSMALVIVAMGGCLAILSSIKSLALGSMAAVGAMAGMAIIVGLLAHMLVLMKDINGNAAIAQVIAISGLLIAMTLCMSLLSVIGSLAVNAVAAIGAMAGLTLVVWALSEVIKGMRDINGQEAIVQVAAISALLVVITLCLALLSVIGALSVNAVPAIGALAGLTLVVWALSEVIKGMRDINGQEAIVQVVAISALLVVITLCLTLLSVIGALSVNAVAAIGAMAGLTLVVWALSEVVKGMQGVNGQEAIKQVRAISELLVVMTACLAVVSLLAPLAVGASAGLLALAQFAGGLVLFLSILGGIDELFKGGLEKVLTRAVDIMKLIGEAIGSFVGGIASGFTDALPQIGKDLSEFADNAGKFFDVVANIDQGVVKNTGLMVAAIGELSAISKYDDGIFNIGSSLPGFGEDLSDFMDNAGGFFEALSNVKADSATGIKNIADAIGILSEVAATTDTSTISAEFANLGDSLIPFGESMVEFSKTVSGKIDSAAVEACATAAQMMSDLNDTLPKEHGTISGWFASEAIPLDTFGEQLVMFGRAIVNFSDIVAGKIDAAAVEAAASAGTMMSDLANSLPDTTDTFNAWFTGATLPLDTFGEQLVMFGRAMVNFSNIVAGKIDAGAVEAAASAGTIMSDLANGLPPKTDTFKAWFSGTSMSLDTFGGQLVLFGRAMINFSNTVKAGISENAVNAAANAGKVMVTMANGLPEEPSLLEKWFGGGTMDMATFGDKLVAFGESIVDFSTAVSGNVDTQTIKTCVTVATDAIKMVNDLPDEIDLSVLSTALTDLADAMVSFSELVSGNVDNETVTTVVNAAKTIAQAASLMPDEVDLAKLTTGLSDFGNAIVEFSEIVNGTVDGESVTTAAQAGKDVALMMAAIPMDIDPTVFIDNLESFGTALVDFAAAVEDVGVYDLAGAQTSCDYIGKMLMSLSGYYDLASFIDNASAMAQAIMDFCTAVSGDNEIDTDAVYNAYLATTHISNALTKASTATDIGIYGQNAQLLARSLKSFSDMVDEEAINVTAITNATSMATKIGNTMSALAIATDIGIYGQNAQLLARSLVSFSDMVDEGAVSITAITTAQDAANKISGIISTLSVISGVSDTISLLGSLGTCITDFCTAVSETNITGLSENSETFKGVVESFGELSDSGVTKFIENLTNASTKTKTAISTFCSTMVSKIGEYKDDFKTAGKSLVDGFSAGITANTFKAAATAKAMAKAALKAAEQALDINSPSKEFYKVGAFAVEGFISAFADYESSSGKAGSTMAKSALLGLRDAIAAAGDIVENGIDAQPTIRPVLDLSDVTSNASAISSLFDTGPTVGVMANVGAISRGMATLQNGSTNDDVVKALGDLRDSLGQRTGDTYTIGNISYDGDSEISTAIKTLIGAARRERRV